MGWKREVMTGYNIFHGYSKYDERCTKNKKAFSYTLDTRNSQLPSFIFIYHYNNYSITLYQNINN